MKFSSRLIVAVFVLTCIVGSAMAMSEQSFVGKAAPEIGADAWLNTTGVKLADSKGKIVIVEFWATWCPPCRNSIPHLAKLYEANKDKGVILVSLTDEDKETVEPFAKEQKMVWPVGLGSKTGGDYTVKGIPHAVIVGRDGKVAWEGHPMDGLDEQLAKAVAAGDAGSGSAAPAGSGSAVAPGSGSEAPAGSGSAAATGSGSAAAVEAGSAAAAGSGSAASVEAGSGSAAPAGSGSAAAAGSGSASGSGNK